jgi:Ca2+-binding EF-hand superfamily protein
MLSSVSSSGTGSAQNQSQIVDRIFKKVDSNQDGKITRDELAQALRTSSGGQGPSVDDIFAVLDTGNKGYITKQDAADGLDKLPPLSAEGAPTPSNNDSSTMQKEIAYVQKQYQQTDPLHPYKSPIYA